MKGNIIGSFRQKLSVKGTEENSFKKSLDETQKDTIMHSGNGKEGYQSINRYDIMKVQTPQAFDFKLIWDKHQKAIDLGSLGAWDNSSMLTQIGEKVYFSEGSDLNLKINTIEDVEMFRALYRMKHPEEGVEK